jgi:hypothetical protein
MMLDVERLDETCIKKLANEELLAIRIKGWLPPPLAIQIGDKILAPGFEGYINAPSIGRIGMAFYEAEKPTAAYRGLLRPRHPQHRGIA